MVYIASWLVFVLAALVSFSTQGQSPIRVAAASDLKFAMDSLVRIFEKEQNVEIRITYGSSGKLAEQILNGAPFDVFFSADESYPDRLQKAGRTDGAPELYGIGRIVIWTWKGDADMQRLTDDQIKKIAIANPQHAPYGRRAVESMKYYGVYDKVKGKLVLGENISQAAQFLYSGAADAGILALSLALSPPMKELKGNYKLVPEEAHVPLRQSYVVLKNGNNGPAMRAFQRFLQEPRAREIFLYFGFSGEQLK